MVASCSLGRLGSLHVKTSQLVFFSMIIRSPEYRQSPSTVLLEHEVDSTEVILRDFFANVTRVSGSSDDVHIRSFIASLKTKTKNYEVANRALVACKEQTDHVRAAKHLAESRLNIVHRDSYGAVRLPNTPLVALGHER